MTRHPKRKSSSDAPFDAIVCYSTVVQDSINSCSQQSVVGQWVPYLSCIRPLSDLLRELYLFTDMPLDPFWEFCHSIGSAAYQFKLKAHQFIHEGASSPAQSNSNSEGAMRTTEA
ncbi:hypothetical protein MRB53_008315 [Persea americana]|uniref:Uncharacterized protein n=1 Tax=Persea americana TaxID=3435 RepID=A0ACC2MLG8_PERAE|nr:hypothetical protein MRB53_008315 [Persea americana]